MFHPPGVGSSQPTPPSAVVAGVTTRRHATTGSPHAPEDEEQDQQEDRDHDDHPDAAQGERPVVALVTEPPPPDLLPFPVVPAAPVHEAVEAAAPAAGGLRRPATLVAARAGRGRCLLGGLGAHVLEHLSPRAWAAARLLHGGSADDAVDVAVLG